MPQPPLTDEISASLARFFFGGGGPSHSKISNVTTGAGYGSDDPETQGPADLLGEVAGVFLG